MKVLLDSNILLRLSQPGHSDEQVTTQAVDFIHQHGHKCVIVPQSVYEYWTVATRPINVNGLGYKIEFAATQRNNFMRLFPMFRDERSIYEHWLRLTHEYRVKGVKSHDTRYVAAMRRHGIRHLLTFNQKDFSRFDEITVLTPRQVVRGYPALR